MGGNSVKKSSSFLVLVRITLLAHHLDPSSLWLPFVAILSVYLKTQSLSHLLLVWVAPLPVFTWNFRVIAIFVSQWLTKQSVCMFMIFGGSFVIILMSIFIFGIMAHLDGSVRNVFGR